MGLCWKKLMKGENECSGVCHGREQTESGLKAQWGHQVSISSVLQSSPTTCNITTLSSKILDSPVICLTLWNTRGPHGECLHTWDFYIIVGWLMCFSWWQESDKRIFWHGQFIYESDLLSLVTCIATQCPYICLSFLLLSKHLHLHVFI